MVFKKKISSEINTLSLLRENIIDVLCESAVLDREEINDGNEHFENDLGMDSIDILNFRYDIEKKFGISLGYKRDIRPEFSSYTTLNEVLPAVAKELNIPLNVDKDEDVNQTLVILRNEIYKTICETGSLKQTGIVTGKESFMEDFGFDDFDMSVLQMDIEKRVCSQKEFGSPYFMFDNNKDDVIVAFDAYVGTPNKIVAVTASALNLI